MSSDQATVSARPAESKRDGGVLPWFHWAVVFMSLGLTLFAWYFSRNQLKGKIAAQFDRETDRVIALVIERMAKYEDALRSGVAFIDTNDGEVDYAAWEKFATSIEIEKRYPGINGIGIIKSFPKDQVAAFVQSRRRQHPDFSIHPRHDGDELWPISSINPLNGNQQALGLDIAHESSRLAAARKARESGAEQITAPIVLVQDSMKTPGFLFYVPFYKPSINPSNPDKQFAGLVYAPFVFRTLMQGVLQKQRRSVAIRISDSADVLFDEHVDTDQDYDPDPLLKNQVAIPLYGRTWEFDVWSTEAFREGVDSSKPATILICGIIIDSLLIGLLLLIARDTRRAEGRAEVMGADLEKLELAARVNHIGIWDYDPVSGSLHWDPQMFALYGRDPNELPDSHESWLENLHPDDRDKSEYLLQDALAGNSAFDCEFRVVHPDGTIRFLSGKAVVFRDDAGNAVRMLGANTDVTERKDVSSELEATRQMQSAILDAAGAAIIATDLEGVIVTFNNAAERMLGYSKEELVNKQNPGVFHDPDEVVNRAKELCEELGREVLPGFEVFVAKSAIGELEQREWTYVRKNGSTVPVLLTVTAIRAQDQTISGYLGIASDISERKRAKTKLEEANVQLARSNDELAQFAYVASHDLQEPLRKVISFCELLQEDCGDQVSKDGGQYIAYIVDGATRMRTLIQDLLAYSRLDSEDRHPTDVDSNQAVQSAIANLYEAIEESGAKITVDDLPVVQATSGQFAQLFQNLIGNAIKYRGDRAPIIHVSGAATDSGWKFTVEDNGIGIDESYRQTVFGIFKRLHTQTEYSGTGIGLAVCKRIVDNLNGRIWVEPSPSGGSIFRVEFPMPITNSTA
ncbi:CHASE domain-containing protein [Planctomycetes bacterium K23_9]|uniref:histidine kinase n=1 Tax=Stieleria marina TaxID=1930275 RepID=A0A517NW86_9BACT|nr:Phytochrome-like protein cph1 [Planctomycetes bacterium K23_9]